MDRATARKERIEFARCFIEIDAGKALPSSVTLAVANREHVDVKVEYEWVPPRCTHCVCFGHVNAQCPAIRIWREKEATKQDKGTECDEPPSNDTTSYMDIESTVLQEQIHHPAPTDSTEEIPNPTKKDKATLAETHFQRYGVQSDFIDDSDAGTEENDDPEVEEEITMEEEPPSPIAVVNPEWTVEMEKAQKRGEERSNKIKEKGKKNLLGLKKPLKETKKGKDKEL